jgi:Skp family chaperone for outer membrane proteins
MRPVLILSLILGCACAAGAADKPEAPRFAVLRLEDTLLAFTLYTSGLEKLKQDVAVEQARLKELEDHLMDLDAKMRAVRKDSDSYAKLSEELEAGKVKDRMLVERGNDGFSRRRAALLKEAYGRLHEELRAYCQDNGIKLVSLAPKPELQSQTWQEVDRELLAQSVLYFDPALDITDAFITYLNERWSAAGSSAGQAPATAPAHH